MLLSGTSVATPTGVLHDAWIRVEGATITGCDVGAPPPDAETVLLPGRTVLPGLIDLHVHGGGGASFTGSDPEEVRRAVAFHRSKGTTRNLASLVTAPVEDLSAALGALAECSEDDVIAGAHLEGPFLSPAYCGAQDPRHLLAPEGEVLARLLAAGRGCVRMVTIAPELPGALDLIRHVVDAGAIAAIGHSNATYEVAHAAVDAGATVATHLFNGMRPLHQREPGIVGATLEREEVVCEVIADGHHLHHAVLGLVFGLARNRTALVTDAISAAGAEDGRYRLGPLVVEVKDRRAHLEGTRTIAGSTTTASESVHVARRAGLGLDQIAEAAAAVPARLLGLGTEVGTIEPGRAADLMVLDAEGELEAVLVGGAWTPVAGEQFPAPAYLD